MVKIIKAEIQKKRGGVEVEQKDGPCAIRKRRGKKMHGHKVLSSVWYILYTTWILSSPRQWESCDGDRSLPPVAMPSARLQSVAIPADGIATDCNPGSKQQQTARVETIQRSR